MLVRFQPTLLLIKRVHSTPLTDTLLYRSFILSGGKSMDTNLRYNLLLVPSREIEDIYVRKFRDSIKHYDKRHHIIYFNYGDPYIVCTLYSKFKMLDGQDIYINVVNTAYAKPYMTDEMNNLVKMAHDFIVNNNKGFSWENHK